MGMKMYKHDVGHKTNMTATPIYGKTPLKNLLRNQWTYFHEILYVAFWTRALILCSNKYPQLT